MNRYTDHDLEDLFRMAKAVKPDVTDIAAGLEDRVSARIRMEHRREPLLSIWTWRLAPVLAVPLFILVLITAVMELQEPHDMFGPTVYAYERIQISKYLMSE